MLPTVEGAMVDLQLRTPKIIKCTNKNQIDDAKVTRTSVLPQC